MYLGLDIGLSTFHSRIWLTLHRYVLLFLLYITALHATSYCFYLHLMSLPLTSYIPNFHPSHSHLQPHFTMHPLSLTYHSMFPWHTYVPSFLTTVSVSLSTINIFQLSTLHIHYPDPSSSPPAGHTLRHHPCGLITTKHPTRNGFGY